MRTALFAFLFASLAAAAEPRPVADLRDTCGAFEVRLHSKSGDPMEDDMSVTLVFPGVDPIAVALPPALYVAREPLLNVKNVCRQLTALDVAGDKVLLLLSRNNRPTWDVLDAVLIDKTTKRVLDVAREIGEIKSENALVVRTAMRGGYDVRLIREMLPDSGCDCADAAIEDWMRIDVRGAKLVTRWSRPFTGPAARRRSVR